MTGYKEGGEKRGACSKQQISVCGRQGDYMFVVLTICGQTWRETEPLRNDDAPYQLFDHTENMNCVLLLLYLPYKIASGTLGVLDVDD